MQDGIIITVPMMFHSDLVLNEEKQSRVMCIID